MEGELRGEKARERKSERRVKYVKTEGKAENMRRVKKKTNNSAKEQNWKDRRDKKTIKTKVK